MILPNICPACMGGSYEILIDLGLLPHSGTFLSGPEEIYSTIHLSFEFCPKCALIRRRFLERDSCNYTHVSRTTSHRLSGYAEEITESLHRRGISSKAFIIEVGANDGAFLDVLAQAGFSKRLGVEPSHTCAEACHSKGHMVEAVHLNQTEALRIRENHGPASAVICRHTLEHVPDPFDFLLALRILLRGDGILFIEVPDARRIIRDMRGYELWDEHIHSFTPDNLVLLLHRAGFQVDEISLAPYRNTINILLWCKSGLSNDGQVCSKAVLSSDIQLCRAFASRWTSLCSQFLDEASDWPRPVVCLGASHHQSNLLLFTGIGCYLAFLVDDDPVKAGRFVPIPQSVPVISTKQLLRDFHQGTLIRGAFGYEDWMDRICKTLMRKGINVFDPCLTLSAYATTGEVNI